MRRYSLTKSSKSKSWSSEQINYNIEQSAVVDIGENQEIKRSRSSLSLSMRYADPWLYDNVQVAFDRSFYVTCDYADYYQQQFKYQQQPAIVLCSCKDYIIGSKRSSKKSLTVCKKCKGCRLPLVGGTVRATKYFNYFDTKCQDYLVDTLKTPKRSGTVKVTGCYSRPSLFSVIDDFQNSKNIFNPTPKLLDVVNRSQVPTLKPNRKSILECNINPYELVADRNSDNIKEINGQRIILNTKKAENCSIPKVVVQNDNSQIPVLLKKESKSTTNRFKSILKRPSSNNSENQSSPSKNIIEKLLNSDKYGGSLSIRSLSKQSASKLKSNFYLPLTKSRKRVQFLVSSDDDEDDKNNKDNDNDVNQQQTKIDKNDEDQETINNNGLMKPIDDNSNKVNVKNLERPKNPPPPPPPPPPPLLSSSRKEIVTEVLLETPKPPPRRKNLQNQKISKKSSTVVYLKNEEEQKNESVVHKLQIRNELSDENMENCCVSSPSSLKTSILINGDDCYSTVNVNNDVPLYQSSVVVKGNEDNLPSAKNIVTISVADNDQVSDEVLETDDVISLTETLVPYDHNVEEIKLLDSDIGNNQSLYEAIDHNSDCYSNNSNRSSVTEDDLGNRSKFYQLLVDAAEADSNLSDLDNHQYEIIKTVSSNGNVVDPIYEDIEISLTAKSIPLQDEAIYSSRSIFEGASKYDILSYLVDAKERGVISDEAYSTISLADDDEDVAKVYTSGLSNCWSTVSDSSEDSSLIITSNVGLNVNQQQHQQQQKGTEVERNDSGIGSETSKSSRSRYQSTEKLVLCEDCDNGVDPVPEDGPMICWRCRKRRGERKDIITEIVETEEKYARDLQIILEEFYQPMLVAGLLTSEQLSAIFLNVEDLLENSLALAERLRDALDIAVEQGDEDLLTVNIGKIFLDASQILHAFESYCVRQGSASLLLASLEKEKELLRIFLHVSQMENTMLRRMNLNSFLMVPVQRVTKYPLLLSRLYKVTSIQHESRVLLREAQHKVELHLSHINSETKDVPSKLWRRISNGSNRMLSSEMDLIKIKLRKIAVDILDWNHEEAQFVLESRLLYTQPNDHHWRKGRMIKLTSINALLVTNGKTNVKYRQQSQQQNSSVDNLLTFPSKTGTVREAALLLIRDKNGRYSLLRDPLYLDKCVIATDPAWQCYFEVQEVLGKDTYVFKAENNDLTKTWYRQLQLHAQGMGAWRKRRNALPNIMIYGMNSRNCS